MNQLNTNQKNMNLSTERLNIRKIEQGDASFILKLRSDINNMQYVEMKPYKNIERAESFIKHVLSDIEKNEVFFWVIETKVTQRKVGTVCLWSFSKNDLSAEIGYELLPTHQKKGYANEAINAVIHFAKDKINLKVINAITHNQHQASISLLKKHGFHSLGYVKDLMPAAEDGPRMKLFKKEL